jgi:hypothetical protein
MDEIFQINRTVDFEGWLHLTAVGDRGTTYYVVLDDFGHVVTRCRNCVAVPDSELPCEVRLAIEECSTTLVPQ